MVFIFLRENPVKTLYSLLTEQIFNIFFVLFFFGSFCLYPSIKMKKLIFLIVLLLPFGMSQAQTHFYEHPDFDEIVKKQELVAILPFKTTINLRPKEMKKITAEQLKELEESDGFSVQSAMYSWFLKTEEKGPLKTDFQDPEDTNAKLKMLGVTIENISEYSPQEIADFLEVDGIIMGTFETSAPHITKPQTVCQSYQV